MRSSSYLGPDDVLDALQGGSVEYLALPTRLSRVVDQFDKWSFDVVENEWTIESGKFPQMKLTAQMSMHADHIGELIVLVEDLRITDYDGVKVTQVTVVLEDASEPMHITTGALSQNITGFGIEQIHIDIEFTVKIGAFWPCFK